jgi:hypothetical protein
MTKYIILRILGDQLLDQVLYIESREYQETTRQNRPVTGAIDIFGPSDEVQFNAMASQYRASHEL